LLLIFAFAGCSTQKYGDKYETLGGSHNEIRKQHNCAKLRVSIRLNLAAQKHAEYMAKHRNMSHQPSAENTLNYRISRTGYKWSRIGENIANGQRNTQEVMKDWMDSPGHKQNILNGSYTDIGMGVAYDINHIAYWCVVFATRAQPTNF